jgi:hypothetical protein
MASRTSQDALTTVPDCLANHAPGNSETQCTRSDRTDAFELFIFSTNAAQPYMPGVLTHQR